MDKARWGVHQAHCCEDHGCKYGDKDCPVVLGQVTQSYRCETCHDEEADFVLLAQRVTKSPERFAKHLSDLSAHTSDPKIIGSVAKAVTALRGY
jgi:hypothetical protein